MTSSDTRFAVYLVPNAEDAFYRLGSAVLGYDVRAAREVPRLPEVTAAWTAKADRYGFHLTVVEAFECDPASFPDIAAEVARVCACFSEHARLHLGAGRTEVWDAGTVIVRRFDASPELLMLHALLLARLERFVTASSFERLVQQHPDRYAAPEERARLRLLRTPRALDGWRPHFTLVDPYHGGDVQGLAARLDERFEPYPTLEYAALSLMRQDAGERYRIVQEFSVGGASNPAEAKHTKMGGA